MTTTQSSRNEVLNILAHKERWQWTPLKEAARVSDRTLKLVLKELRNEGKVDREVDTETGEYPPPVYYSLTPEGVDHVQPFAFANLSSSWAEGIQWTTRVTEGDDDEGEGNPVLVSRLSFDMVHLENTTALHRLGRRRHARLLFALWKTLETGSQEWYSQVTSGSVGWEIFTVLAQLGLDELFTASCVEDWQPATNRIVVDRDQNVWLEVPRIVIQWPLEGAAPLARRFRSALEEAYPEEVAELDAIWRDVESGAYRKSDQGAWPTVTSGSTPTGQTDGSPNK